MSTTAASLSEKPLRRSPGLQLNLFKYLWTVARSLPLTMVLARKILRDLTMMTILGWWWLAVRAVMPTIALIAVLGFVLEEGALTELPIGLFVIPGMAVLIPLQIGLQRGTRSMVQLRRVMDVMYVPRLNVSLAALSMSLIYFAVFMTFSVAALAYYMISYRHWFIVPSWNLLFVPALFLLLFVFIWSVISITSVIMLMARDIRFVQPIIIQLLLVFSPIMYPLSKLPETLQSVLLKVNPLVAIIETLRWSLYGIGALDLFHLLWTTSLCLLTFVVAAWFLMRSEWIWEEVI